MVGLKIFPLLYNKKVIVIPHQTTQLSCQLNVFLHIFANKSRISCLHLINFLLSPRIFARAFSKAFYDPPNSIIKSQWRRLRDAYRWVHNKVQLRILNIRSGNDKTRSKTNDRTRRFLAGPQLTARAVPGESTKRR